MTKLSCALFFALTMATVCPAAQPEPEVRAAMEGWKQATLRKDPAALDKLFHKNMTYTHSSGLEQDKKACIDLATAPKTKIEAIEFSDMTVRMYGGIAIVKTNAAVTSASSGRSATSHIIVLHVWLKTPQGWQTIARQATRASPVHGQPFADLEAPGR